MFALVKCNWTVDACVRLAGSKIEVLACLLPLTMTFLGFLEHKLEKCGI